jgi:hypothetical protein
MQLETLRLHVQFRERLPQGTWPEHVRRLCLGIMDDGHPAWPTVCNHRMIYPRLHFNVPGPDGFYFTGLGPQGKDAILALVEAFQRSTLVLGTQRLTLAGISMLPGTFELKVTRGLQRFSLRSPIHMFDHHNRFRERTGDLAKDYQFAFRRHFRWLFGQFGLELGGEPVVEVRDIEERPRRLKRERSLWPALVRASIVTNLSLPPAIGHGVGLGWGQLKWHRDNAAFN